MNHTLTVVILTQNEAANLPRCLNAIPRRLRVIVLDSGSDDHSVDIAKEWGCSVYFNPWQGFASQRNSAMQNCQIAQGWA